MAKYKFCFLCNTNESFSSAMNVLIDGRNEFGSNEANPGRFSFSALLYPTEDDESADDVTDDVTTVVEDVPQNVERESRPLCAKDYVLDPMQCVCRPVQCEAGLRIDGDKCTEVFLSTNMHAFSLCSRYHIKAEQPIRRSQMYSFFSSLMMTIDEFGSRFEVSFQGFPHLACDDNTSLTVDVHMEIHNGLSTLFTKRVKSMLTFMKNFAGNSSAFHPAHMTAETPAPRCLDVWTWIKSLPPNCSTRNISGSVGAHFYEMRGKKNVSLTSLYNTTLCPRVNLTKTEFSTFSTQLHDLGFTSDIIFDVTFEKDETFHLLCAEDFWKILLPNSCMAKTTMPEDKSTAGFQDMWTVQGLMSMVSTCVSLVSLLCVMVTYMALPPLRAGTGLSTLAMACLLFVAQALHEMGLEQYEIHLLCLVLALLIHFFWLSAVFMMTSCTIQLFAALVFPLSWSMVFERKACKQKSPRYIRSRLSAP
ncbi:hypothetical protein V1264_012017 [Littorina saxatilis]|uniref:Uncharacterized protein n=1 Tax=Littorina saxatilis TaxID=31220 RepID=A0AAN9BVC5_9CAEN